jgi:multisubunit Na+/H+ antiporter MnhG subunit
MPPSSNQSQQSSPAQSWPPRPRCRPAPARAGTVCFWVVFAFFFAAIGYLGLLAYTRNAGQSQPNSGTEGHLVLGLMLAAFAIAAVLGVIATRYKRLH